MRKVVGYLPDKTKPIERLYKMVQRHGKDGWRSPQRNGRRVYRWQVGKWRKPRPLRPGERLPGQTFAQPAEDYALCSDNVLHAFRTIKQARRFFRQFGRIWLFEAEGVVVVNDKDKVGCSQLRITRRVPDKQWVDKDHSRDEDGCLRFRMRRRWGSS